MSRRNRNRLDYDNNVQEDIQETTIEENIIVTKEQVTVNKPKGLSKSIPGPKRLTNIPKRGRRGV